MAIEPFGAYRRFARRLVGLIAHLAGEVLVGRSDSHCLPPLDLCV